jgi:hypothetical protein
VTVRAISPLAQAANDVREAIARTRRIPLSDDVLLRYQQAEHFASALRRAAT